MEGGSSIQDADTTISGEDERPKGFFNFFCHPLGTGHRFVALIFMCFLSFGSYFCYDNPAALQDYLKKDLNLTETQYTALYSVYSWPNVVLNVVGGFLIDRVFGIRLGSNIYVGLTVLGQLAFATGVFFNQYWFMLIGRFIFGIGGESLTVAQNNYAVLWFRGKELNMVFGLQLSFARVGSTVNFLVMESLYNYVLDKNSNGQQVLGIVLFISCTTCLFSWFCSIIMGIFDKRVEKVTRRNETVSGEVVKITDVKDFKASFWLVCVICVLFYCAIFPFITIAKEFFKDKFNFSQQGANTLSSIIYIISGVSSPILGLIIDKIGMNITWIFVGISVTMGAHALLAFTVLTPYIGIVIMGMSYSILASSLWPLVSMIIPEYQLGTAYGVAGSFQNLGLALFSIFTGLIVDHLGYEAIEIFFICSLAGALISTGILWKLDKSRKEGLNMTPGNRIRHLQTISENESKKGSLRKFSNVII
ncbi:lysosomal dipeptide transporter MFSD1 isoform X2 [Leptinotarsa decemlineata]|uniref:lysosomal dipeptide transporter MFSD1 isoform X2 n=1 Tax=Leptinotarsa decemlineata TaxID=7539 RepID=UPI003D308573